MWIIQSLAAISVRRRCTASVVAPAANRCCISGVALEFKVRRTRKSLGGAVEQFTIDMKEAKHLSALKKAVAVFKHVMAKFHQDDHAYKVQIAVDVIFHKAVNPAVITQPPVTLTSEMVAVYSDVPPLEDVNSQLVNFIEVYKLNGSGWVFSEFALLKLTLWHLDPLRAIAFVPLPGWIKDKKAVVNVTGTGNDCFKWAVLAGMHPASDHSDSKYDFSSLHFPVATSSIGSFAVKNNLSINVYGIDNDKKVIYPLRVTEAVIAGRHVDLLLRECNGIQHCTTIRSFSHLISGQVSNHNGAIYCCKKYLHAYSTKELLTEHAVDCCHVQRTKFPKTQDAVLPTYRSNYRHLFVVYADFESILKPVNYNFSPFVSVHITRV